MIPSSTIRTFLDSKGNNSKLSDSKYAY